MDPARASWTRRRLGLRKTDFRDAPVSRTADRAAVSGVETRSLVSVTGPPASARRCSYGPTFPISALAGLIRVGRSALDQGRNQNGSRPGSGKQESSGLGDARPGAGAGE